ncbi:MAG: hypothetical protein LUQ44_02565 [Methanothrix sp.]|nr:hypothetical protein [Methanothrix sp.]
MVGKKGIYRIRQRKKTGKRAMRDVWANSAPFRWKMLCGVIVAALYVMTAAYSYAEVDIDYSHNLMGTGTVMSDFKMGSKDDTLAAGRVRGSGEVMNRYAFLINDSKNVSIEDQFIFHELPEATEMDVPDYPPMTEAPMRMRLLGTAWAARINLTGQ